MKRNVVILGSSRKDGDTEIAVDKLASLTEVDIVDLNDYRIGYYDYEHKNRNDDYIPLMRNLIDNYDTFIFATTVYWYSMSGIIFF